MTICRYVDLRVSLSTVSRLYILLHFFLTCPVLCTCPSSQSWGIEEKEEVRRGVRLLVEAQLLQDHEAELARNLAREFGAGGGSNAIHGDGDGNTSIDATMMPAAAPVAGAGVADAETMGSMRSQPPRSRVAAAKHAVRGVLALRKKH